MRKIFITGGAGGLGAAIVRKRLHVRYSQTQDSSSRMCAAFLLPTIT